jgi:hypothetical protein
VPWTKSRVWRQIGFEVFETATDSVPHDVQFDLMTSAGVDRLCVASERKCCRRRAHQKLIGLIEQ